MNWYDIVTLRSNVFFLHLYHFCSKRFFSIRHRQHQCCITSWLHKLQSRLRVIVIKRERVNRPSKKLWNKKEFALTLYYCVNFDSPSRNSFCWFWSFYRIWRKKHEKIKRKEKHYTKFFAISDLGCLVCKDLCLLETGFLQEWTVFTPHKCFSNLFKISVYCEQSMRAERERDKSPLTAHGAVRDEHSSTQTISVSDRQAGEAALSGRITPGSSRCTKHTLTHNQ